VSVTEGRRKQQIKIIPLQEIATNSATFATEKDDVLISSTKIQSSMRIIIPPSYTYLVLLHLDAITYPG